MNFSLGNIDEAKEAAKQADSNGGNYVSEPGAYFGPVKSAILKEFDTGSAGMEITIETEEGQACKVLIFVRKKDGTSTYTKDGKTFNLPGVNTIRGSLLPSVMLKELPAVKGADGTTSYPTLVGRQLGMLVNIKKTLGKTNGQPDPKKVFDNADLVTFFCPKNGKCGSEILEKVEVPVRKAEIEKTLKIIDETAIIVTKQAVNSNDPFGEGSSGSTEDDPFGTGDKSTDTTIDDTAKAESDAKAKLDAEAKAKVKADAKLKAEADAKAKLEADAKVKAEEDAKVNDNVKDLPDKSNDTKVDDSSGSDEDFWD